MIIFDNGLMSDLKYKIINLNKIYQKTQYQLNTVFLLTNINKNLYFVV